MIPFTGYTRNIELYISGIINLIQLFKSNEETFKDNKIFGFKKQTYSAS